MKHEVNSPSRRLPADPLSELLGIRHRVAAEGRAVSNLSIDGRHRNLFGAVHGAVIFAMADVGMGHALASVLERNTRTASASITANYMKAPIEGDLVAESVLVSRGRKLATLQSEVRDGNGVLCALMTGIFYISGEQGRRE